MFNYLVRRLILLPITLFFIVLVNFVIINLAPGEPVSITEISPEGTASRRANSTNVFSDERYLQFREFYGLTLPILYNNWPSLDQSFVDHTLWILVNHRQSEENAEEMSAKDYNDLKVKFGDQSPFVMPLLLKVINDQKESLEIRGQAARFFIRGSFQLANVGSHLTEKQKQVNEKLMRDNDLLQPLAIKPADTVADVENKAKSLTAWYNQNKELYHYEPSRNEKIGIFFFDTRFCRYISRVLTLNFGTLRNDENKTVISEVARRFKYSLTLSLIPMLITFVLCQLFGFVMAYKQNRWPDLTLNLTFLILYAIPVFIVAPFLIEMAINKHFPFTDIPIPISGFTSPDDIYNQETSLQRLYDVLQHILLPVIAIMYGSLAAQARLARTSVLEVLRQDYVRTAWAKGLSPTKILFKHVGRNSAITIVTSLAGSLGIVLGGSLIVETLFEINGFGKFFYDAVVNRDYNVIMFSTLAGSLLTLIGYLIADIAYTLLDPRLTLD